LAVIYYKMDNTRSNDVAVASEDLPSNSKFATIARPNTKQPSPLPAKLATARPPSQTQTSNQITGPDGKMLEHFEFFGEDNFTIAFFLWLFLLLGAILCAPFFLSLSWITAAVAVVLGFVFVSSLCICHEAVRPDNNGQLRHVMLKRHRFQAGSRWLARPHPDAPIPDTDSLPAVYFLYVLGSGGHSAEMVETIKQKFRGQKNQHRRYIVTSGDKSSLSMVTSLESIIRDAYPGDEAGTSDVFRMQRARAVHQSLLTAPFTCLVSAAHAINALTREPNLRPATKFGYQFKYPHVVITNGPATGFIVALVAHILKIFNLVPPSRLKTVYIESWARTTSLSLTGKLFLWTGIANKFCVQHEPLARSIPGAEYAGRITARLTPVG